LFKNSNSGLGSGMRFQTQEVKMLVTDLSWRLFISSCNIAVIKSLHFLILSSFGRVGIRIRTQDFLYWIRRGAENESGSDTMLRRHW
jgi:hypothetical protein